MTWRRLALLALLLVIGVGGGFGASLASGRQLAASGVPAPVVAASPSYPVDPEPVYVADPAVEPLPVSLPLSEARLGTKDFRYTFPVPADWVATPNFSGTTTWRNPANPPKWTYVLRVELVGDDNRTVAQTLEGRIAELDDVEQDVETLARTADTLVYSYVTDGHLRVGVLRWLRPQNGPFAEVEVAATGRAVDRPGLEALVAEVSAGMRRE